MVNRKLFSICLSAKIHLILLLLALYTSQALGAKKAKTVTAVLDSKWMHTPLLLEISEYLADENNEFFWGFVDSVVENTQNSTFNAKIKTDKETYDFAFEKASKFLSPLKLSLLKFSLSLREYSPKIELFSQIAKDKVPREDCSAFVEINDEVTCDELEVHRMINEAENRIKPPATPLDHHLTDGEMLSISVILYGEIGTKTFAKFHKLLKEYALDGKVDYMIRHYMQDRSPRKIRLSGYGAELAIKSSEYKAQDDTKVKADTKASDDGAMEDDQEEVEGFVFSTLKQLHPDKQNKLEEFKDHLLETTNKMAPLKVWQIQELSLQAAQRIMSAPVEEALKLTRDISQNFPLLANTLVKTVVKDELRTEIIKNQMMFAQHHSVNPTDSGIFINGIFYDMEVTDVYTIMDTIRDELMVMDGLHGLGVPTEVSKNLLSMDIGTEKATYAVDIRDSAIQYINDLEKDPQYKAWPSSIMDILRPTYPGMLRTIRKNMYHLVFILDPSSDVAREMLKLSESFLVHMVPIRIGIVLAVNRDQSVTGEEDAGIAMLNAFNFISIDKESLQPALSFLTDVYNAVEDRPIESADVQKLFKKKYPDEDFSLVFGEDSDYNTGRKLAWEFIDKTGLKSPHVLVNGIPLDEKTYNADMFEEAVLGEIMKLTNFFQRSVYRGEITDNHNIIDYIMNQPHVMPRLNENILSNKGSLLDMTGKPGTEIQLSEKKFYTLNAKDATATILTHMKYFTYKDDFSYRPITLWLVLDLETSDGRDLLRNALEHLKSTNDFRIGLIFNQESSLWTPLNSAVLVALTRFTKTVARNYVLQLLEPENVEAIAKGEKSPWEVVVKNMDTDSLKRGIQINSVEVLHIHQYYTRKVLGLKPGQIGVVSNGRIIGLLESDQIFNKHDFSLLERHTLNSYAEKLRTNFETINNEGEQDSISDLAMRVSALLLSRPESRTRQKLEFWGDEFSVVKVPARIQGLPEFEIMAVTDPTSRWTHKLTAILIALHQALNCKIWLFLNSQEKLSEMPLKSFYRFVLYPELQFQTDGSLSAGPAARFTGMPEQPLLTLNMHTPDNWMIEVKRSPYDLDNIHLEEVKTMVHGEFELEHLLLEGHCFEQSTGSPPRGLQFTLGTSKQPDLFDTIVMANLGYFQLKAGPGSWLLRLRRGTSSDIYDIVNSDGTDVKDGKDVEMFISSFRSRIVKIRVNKKQGMEEASLLDDNGKEGKKGLWNSITSSFSGGKDSEEKDDKINIFSLASGHLYERFLRIMIVSVVKTASMPVKFWFLNNYLSPTFKDFLPHMAKSYKFEYELVQYKWPRWLHQQTEKQRIIWGYKILFLDVLFPLHVKKIIFVDADQVVRSDLKELIDLDLGGAPYGYTPFCESRKEMDGFRFWKSGYWASHLAGRKYHISALYVVDLKRFRRVAAGDRLRGQYQGLSMDPNSLSNLDQDLPNNMIHQVAIKSLPQEWLWCETWCDDKSKEKAKTIDLCNNPQTKEPKLTSAMRIIPEWKTYDDEIKELQSKVAKLKTEENRKKIIEEAREQSLKREATKDTAHHVEL